MNIIYFNFHGFADISRKFPEILNFWKIYNPNVEGKSQKRKFECIVLFVIAYCACGFSFEQTNKNNKCIHFR